MCIRDRPTSGSVYIGRHGIDKMTERELTLCRQKFTGFVFQSYNLIPSLTALENVAMPLMFKGVGKQEREARACLLYTSLSEVCRVCISTRV